MEKEAKLKNKRINPQITPIPQRFKNRNGKERTPCIQDIKTHWGALAFSFRVLK
jgi:hypothetical protein